MKVKYFPIEVNDGLEIGMLEQTEDFVKVSFSSADKATLKRALKMLEEEIMMEVGNECERRKI